MVQPLKNFLRIVLSYIVNVLVPHVDPGPVPKVMAGTKYKKNVGIIICSNNVYIIYKTEQKSANLSEEDKKRSCTTLR